MTLKTALSCEIEDLAQEIMKVSGRSYDEVEDALEKLGIYPDNKKTFLMISIVNDKESVVSEFSLRDYPTLEWVDSALLSIFKDLEIKQIYVTHAI